MKTTTLKVEITEPMAKLLQGLVDTGLYGLNQEEAARRILESELRAKQRTDGRGLLAGILDC